MPKKSGTPTCQICGRALSSPESISAGVGPICGGRNYKGRISSRHQGGYGWTNIQEWEAHNEPCYTCIHFQLPGKEQEIEDGDEFLVFMQGMAESFPADSIGGHCKKLKNLCDGNAIRRKAACHGEHYEKREDKRGAIDGVLKTPLGDIGVQLGSEDSYETL